MEHKIINTKDYLLIVDDSEIKKETYCYDSINNILVFYKGSMKNIGFQKVISHLPLNNSPILEGVILLPSLEDFDNIISDIDFKGDTNSFISGYKKHAEKYKYTKEDMRKVFNYGKGIGSLAMKDDFDEYIQSLQQPKMPVGFKREMVNCDKCVYVQGGNLSPDCCNQLKPKTTTNSQGLTQWVGEYIY